MIDYFVIFYLQNKVGFMGVAVNYVASMLVPLLFDKIKWTNWKSYAIIFAKMLVCAVVMQVLCMFYYAIFGIDAMTQICCGIILLVYVVFFNKDSLKSKVISSISYFSIIAIVVVVCFSINDLMRLAGSDENEVILFFLNLVMMLGCTLFFRLFSVRNNMEVPSASIVMVAVVGVANTLFWIITNVTPLPPPPKIAIGLILIILLITANYSAYVISKKADFDRKRRTEVILQAMDEKMLRLGEENLESMRRIRHEFKNQFAYMKTLIVNKDYDKLSEHFDELTNKIFDTVNVIDCGNFTVNAILNTEKSRANRLGVAINCNIEVPKMLEISDVDLCSLLMNMLNNALEYYERNSLMQDKIVKVFIRLVNQTLFIEVRNKICPEDVKEALTLKTSKKDKAYHGYGVKMMEKITKLYAGEIKYSVSGGEFIVKAIVVNEKETEGRN